MNNFKIHLVIDILSYGNSDAEDEGRGLKTDILGNAIDNPGQNREFAYS